MTGPHGAGMGYVGPELNDTDLPRSQQNANTPPVASVLQVIEQGLQDYIVRPLYDFGFRALSTDNSAGDELGGVIFRDAKPGSRRKSIL
ncbi:MAG: hypothetical protein KDB01_02365 [Planctomycetaceae bacterium]|nr:hypothetical protein [Planctomycetaceae bacterium]